ncbi:trithorax group protein osa isoform X1 [Coregonus clupeaformis]|nr:trithorax group protein osa isoform X1 [Coregonus clupeaformis]
MVVPVYLGSMVLFCLLSVAVNSPSFPRGRSYGYVESGQRLTEEPQYYRSAHHPSQHDQVHSSSAWSSTFPADFRSKGTPVDFRLAIPFQRLSSPLTTSTSSPGSNQKGGAPSAGPAQGGPDPNQDESAPSGSDTQREVSHSPIGKIQGVKGRWVFIPDKMEPTNFAKTQTGKTNSPKPITAIYPIPLATGPPQYGTNPSGYYPRATPFPMYYPNPTSSVYPIPMWYGPTQDVKVSSGYNPGQVKPPTSNFGKGQIGQAISPKPTTAAGPAPVGSSTPQPGNVPSGHYQDLKNPTSTHFGGPQTGGGQAGKKPSPVQTGSEPDSSRMESSQNRRPAPQRYTPSYGPPYSVGGQYTYKPPIPIKPDPVPTNVGYGQNGGAPSDYYYSGQENLSLGYFGKRLTQQTMPPKPTVDPVPNTSDPTHYGNDFLVQTKPSISNSGIGQAGKKPSVQKGSELGPPSHQIRPAPQSYTPSYGSPYSMDSQYTFNPPSQKKPSTSHSGRDHDGKKPSPGPNAGPVSELDHSITGSSGSRPAPQSYTPTYDAPYSVGSQYNFRRPVNPDKTDYHRDPVHSNVGYGQNVAPSGYYYSGQEQPSTSYFDKAQTGQTRPPKRVVEAKPYPSQPASAQSTADPSKTSAAQPSASPYSMYGQYNYPRPVTPDQNRGASSGYYLGQQQPSTNYFSQGPTGQPMLPISIIDVDPVPYPTHYRTFYPGQTQLSTTNSGRRGQVGKNPSLGQQGSEHGSPNRKYSRPVPPTYSHVYGSLYSVGGQNPYNLPMPVEPEPVPTNVGYGQNGDTQEQPEQTMHTKLTVTDLVPNLFLTRHGNYYTGQKQPFTPNSGMGQAGKKPSPAPMTEPVSDNGQRGSELVSSSYESPQGSRPARPHYIPRYGVPYSVGSQYNLRRPVNPDKTDYHRDPVHSNVGYGQNVAPSGYYYSGQEQPSTSYFDKAQTGQTRPPKHVVEANAYPSQPALAQSTADPSKTSAAQPSASPYSMYGQYNYPRPVTPDQNRGASSGYYSGQQQPSISYFSRGQTAQTTRPIPIIDVDPVPYASTLYRTYYPGQIQPSTTNSGGGQAGKKPSPGQQGSEHGSPNPKSSRPVPHSYTPGYGSPYNVGGPRPVTFAQTDYYPVPSNIGYDQNGGAPSGYYSSGQENPSTSYFGQSIPPKAFIKAKPYPSQPSSAQSTDDPSRNSAVQRPASSSQPWDHKTALEVNMVVPFHSGLNPNAANQFAQIASDSSNMKAESGEEPSPVQPTPASAEGGDIPSEEPSPVQPTPASAEGGDLPSGEEPSPVQPTPASAEGGDLPSGEEPSPVQPTPESDEGAGPRGFMPQILPQRNYAQSWSGSSRGDVVPGRPEFRMN